MSEKEDVVEAILAAFWGKAPRCDLMSVTASERGCSAWDEPEAMCLCRRTMLANARAALAAAGAKGWTLTRSAHTNAPHPEGRDKLQAAP